MDHTDAVINRPGAAVLPEGTRLLHIGPPKTATSAIQAAFYLAREACEQQGVHYAGWSRHSSAEVRAVVGLPSAWSEERKPPSIVFWNRLAREIRTSKARCVVLSSEDMAHAEEPAIRRVVEDVGGRAHVVVTLRPLARLLPSQWQQYVRSRLTEPFDSWLDATLAAWDQPAEVARRDPRGVRDFWSRHRHDELIRRWANVVGADAVSVIIVDENDRAALFRTFERLIGLRAGTLVPDPAISNRSLTLPEIEMIRAFNGVAKANDMGRSMYTRVIRRGAVLLLERRRPPADETKVALPASSVERVAAISREMVGGIKASGARVIGDPELLTRADTTRGEGPQQVVVTPELAATAMFDLLVAAGAVRDRRPAADAGTADSNNRPALGITRGYGEPPELFRLSTPQLALALARRSRAAVMGRLDRVMHPRRGRRSDGSIVRERLEPEETE